MAKDIDYKLNEGEHTKELADYIAWFTYDGTREWNKEDPGEWIKQQ